MWPILQLGGYIMYSYMFHIMKYYFPCICANISALVVKDFTWSGKMTALSYNLDN
jgi:hypothetical protein